MLTIKRILAVLVFILAFTTAFSQQISISPTILPFKLGPGQSESKVIRVTNTSDKKQSFQTTLGDWKRDTAGNHQYFEPNSTSRSCASWVTVLPSFFEVQPNETVEILVTIQGPIDPKLFEQVRWAMLFIQGTVEKTDPFVPTKTLSTQIREFYRVGVHIYETPPTLTTSEAKIVSLEPSAGTKPTYSLTIKNTGSLMLDCKTHLELTNLESGKELKTGDQEFPVFPEGIRSTYFELPANLPKGKYSVLGILDYGDSMPLEAIEKTIEIK